MDDLAQLYSSTLAALGEALIKMTSPQWDAMLQQSTQEERSAALKLMLKVQEARLTLANTALASIVDKMQANEADLRAGIASMQKSLKKLEKVETVLQSISTVITVAAKLIPMLA